MIRIRPNPRAGRVGRAAPLAVAPATCWLVSLLVLLLLVLGAPALEARREAPPAEWSEDARAAVAAAREQGIAPSRLVYLLELERLFPEHAHGIDVSHHQGEIRWMDVALAGVDFAYFKASEGVDYEDPHFVTHWRAAGAEGILRGAYHMFRPEDDAHLQARQFLDTLYQGGVDAAMLPPVLDIERVSSTDRVPRTVLRDRALEWLRRVEDALGVRPILYTNPSFWRDVLRDEDLRDEDLGDEDLGDDALYNDDPGEADGTALHHYPLWISEYAGARAVLGEEAPPDLGAWDTWTFWQLSEHGVVPGVQRPVDLNRFSGDRARLRQLVEDARRPSASPTSAAP